ncbi:MAG: hypothetical protein ACLGH8_05685 [Bacteroidia bacterium]
MADAMSYEYLIRRVYQIGRFGNNDANADIYRKLEKAEKLYNLETENIEKEQPRISMQSIDDIAYEYRVQCRKVWAIIEVAIRYGISKNRDVLTDNNIKEMENSIIEPKIVIKEHIDNAIDTAEKIYINHKIYPA